jgi:dipeptidyl aminopeptidase/acylaminoacyl peptidase
MRTAARIVCLGLLTCWIGFANAEDDPADASKLRLDLLLEWESVSDPKLSPDGNKIVFTRTWNDRQEDKRQSELWIMDADGGRQRQLTEGSDAQWSPSGDRIAFVREGKPKGNQVHVMWVETREVTQITHVDEKPSGLRWSPDGEWLSMRMVVPEKDDLLKIKLPEKPKGAKWAEEPTIITRLAYRRDQSGYRAKGFYHLFVVSAQGGTPRQVTQGDYDHQEAEWTPDGKSLVYSGLRQEDADWQIRESEVYVTNVESSKTQQLTDRRGPDFEPKVSPDGKKVAYLGFDDNKDTYNVDHLYVMNIDGSDVRLLSGDFDREPRQVTWGANSRELFFVADSEGATNLYRTNLSGQRKALSRSDVTFELHDIGRNGMAVGLLSSPQQPTDVATFEAKRSGATFTRLTAVNDDLLQRVTLGEVEEIRYASSDGMPVQGWIVKPPDFDPAKKYPLILQIHGGPHAMYRSAFDFERQNHAAEGYVVLYTNPRGSTGYGKNFGNAINNAYPGKDYDDLMRGVDEVIARGNIDEDNLFVYGGSGGGVLTCWIVGNTQRFKAAVSMFPVTNWISFVGTTDGPYWYHNFAKYPWEDISEHWERSPLRLVGNVTTPTLLITGELDLRTPMSQTEEYYQALKLRKVDTAMIRVQDEYHGAARRHPSNQLRRILYVRGWFGKYQTPVEGAAEGSETTSR